jgi:hypothetical protein
LVWCTESPVEERRERAEPARQYNNNKALGIRLLFILALETQHNSNKGRQAGMDMK